MKATQKVAFLQIIIFELCTEKIFQSLTNKLMVIR